MRYQGGLEQQQGLGATEREEQGESEKWVEEPEEWQLEQKLRPTSQRTRLLRSRHFPPPHVLVLVSVPVVSLNAVRNAAFHRDVAFVEAER